MFNQTMEVHMKGRVFEIEATLAVKSSEILDGEGNVVETTEKSSFYPRIFEEGGLVNADQMPPFEKSDDAIQWGFEFLKDFVKIKREST